jgi:MFS family permease
MVVGNTPVTLFTFGLFLKPVTEELGWSRATFATALFASQAAGALSMPLVGKLIDRQGIRRVTLIFIVVFSLATSLLSQARSPGQFLVLYAISGLAGSGRGPIAYAKAISASFERQRGLALGIAMAGLGIGTAVVPQITRLLIMHFGWRGAYVGLGLLTFAVSFPAVALFIREPERGAPSKVRSPADHKTESAARFLQIEQPGFPLGTIRFGFLILALFLVATSLNGAFTHIVPLLTDRGISIRFATSILSFSAVALIVGQITSGYMLDRLFAIYVAGFFFFISVVGIVLISVPAFEIVPIVGGTCLALGIGAESNLAAFFVSRYFGLQRFSEMFGYVLAVSVFGNGAGPWLMARCFDVKGSYSFALFGFGLALVLAIVLISRLGPYRFPPALTFSEISPVPRRTPNVAR